MRAMVLNDGETFTGVAGCKIVDVPDDIEGDDIDEAIKDGEATTTLYEFTGEEPEGPAGEIIAALAIADRCTILEALRVVARAATTKHAAAELYRELTGEVAAD